MPVLLALGAVWARNEYNSGNETVTKIDATINGYSARLQKWFDDRTAISTYAVIFNEYRQSKGLPPLVFTDDLNKIAAQRVEEIKKDFGHKSQLNSYLAENIAKGISDNGDALDIWKNSPPHNKNLLGHYVNTGYCNRDGYSVQVFSSWDTINGIPQLPPGWYFQ